MTFKYQTRQVGQANWKILKLFNYFLMICSRVHNGISHRNKFRTTFIYQENRKNWFQTLQFHYKNKNNLLRQKRSRCMTMLHRWIQNCSIFWIIINKIWLYNPLYYKFDIVFVCLSVFHKTTEQCYGMIFMLKVKRLDSESNLCIRNMINNSLLILLDHPDAAESNS